MDLTVAPDENNAPKAPLLSDLSGPFSSFHISPPRRTARNMAEPEMALPWLRDGETPDIGAINNLLEEKRGEHGQGSHPSAERD